MKIILSRKGFDSSYGCYPSIVLPSGSIISLPIPLSDDKRRFCELACENSDLLGLMNELGIRGFDSSSTCHLDPDINEDFIRRPRGWRGAFGQVGAAQSHLENHNVKIGDMFLFFGWFRKTIKDSQGQYKYTGPDFHLIYGYLQIGEILKVNADSKLPQWLMDHPHTNHEKYLLLQGGRNNTIYLGSDELTFLKGIPGYGCLRYGPKLVLTKPGETRTHWDMPQEFKNVKITYHTDRSWRNGYFQSAHRGQEFIFDEANVVEDWGRDMIKAGLGIYPTMPE